MTCGLAWLMCLGIRSAGWGQLCARKLGQMRKGNWLPWSPAVMVNPPVTEPGKAEGLGYIVWVITSS